MTKKLFIKTWGCQMNEYDSSRMADLLNKTHELELTDTAEDADVLVLNTCSIREKAQEKVFSQLGQWKNFKQDKPDLLIAVGGCVASQEGEAIRERAPLTSSTVLKRYNVFHSCSPTSKSRVRLRSTCLFRR